MTSELQNEQGKRGRVDTHVVKEFDISRFMGKWYEIARFDHRFERRLEGVTALYTLHKNGKIRVVNSGYRDGLLNHYHETKGWAKMPDPREPGKLKVSFFWFFYSDYLVLELDEQYRYVLVGSSSDKYLWILSRTPKMPLQNLQLMLKKARDRGYDTGKLIYVVQ